MYWSFQITKTFRIYVQEAPVVIHDSIGDTELPNLQTIYIKNCEDSAMSTACDFVSNSYSIEWPSWIARVSLMFLSFYRFIKIQ